MKFAKITETEISALAEKKAGGLAILVFSTLSFHDLRKTGKVFPEYQEDIRIVGRSLSHPVHLQSIEMAGGSRLHQKRGCNLTKPLSNPLPSEGSHQKPQWGSPEAKRLQS